MPVFNGTISSKLPKTGTSIFTIMSNLAHEHNAINLSQGFPNFNCDRELVSLVNQNMEKGFNQYAPMAGLMVLREAIAEKTEQLYGASFDPETEITVTAGATQAIYTAISAIVRDGDEVIIFCPAYDCYQPAIELCGGKTVYVHLKYPNYNIDWEGVKKLINHRTKMIIINTPHNPSGTILTASDMTKLEKITENTDMIILSDEVYEHILFDQQAHQSVARFPKLAERSFIVSSFGKTYHTTGWKIGYCIAPKNLMAEFRKVHQYVVFCTNTPIQYALTEYLKKKDAYIELGAFYQQKRDKFNHLIKSSRFKINPSKGTYFQLLDYAPLTNEKDVDFAIRLTKEHGIASIPVSVFYNVPIDNNTLRFCFAKDDETLEKAAEILCKI